MSFITVFAVFSVSGAAVYIVKTLCYYYQSGDRCALEVLSLMVRAGSAGRSKRILAKYVISGRTR